MKLSIYPERINKVLVHSKMSLTKVLPCMDNAGHGILLVVNDGGKLVGVITDGNIRRGLLNNESFDQPCSNFASSNALTCGPDVTAAEALELMNHGKPWKLNHLPVVVDGRPGGLILRSDLMEMEELPLKAVIMAGGFGTRLQPHTHEMPKPMLPVDGKPMLEHIVGQLRNSGVKRMHITTHYKANMIQDHFGDGSSHGVDVNYVNEDAPLGTAGALGLLSEQKEPLLVMNGDIITKLDFRKMLDFHKEHKAEMTVAVRHYDLRVPFGVVETEKEQVRGITEKPCLKFLVNAGIYLLEPTVIQTVPAGQRLDMTDLIDILVKKNCSVVSFPLVEYWLDVGTPLDYERANEKAADEP